MMLVWLKIMIFMMQIMLSLVKMMIFLMKIMLILVKIMIIMKKIMLVLGVSYVKKYDICDENDVRPG